MSWHWHRAKHDRRHRSKSNVISILMEFISSANMLQPPWLSYPKSEHAVWLKIPMPLLVSETVWKVEFGVWNPAASGTYWWPCPQTGWQTSLYIFQNHWFERPWMIFNGSTIIKGTMFMAFHCILRAVTCIISFEVHSKTVTCMGKALLSLFSRWRHRLRKWG